MTNTRRETTRSVENQAWMAALGFEMTHDANGKVQWVNREFRDCRPIADAVSKEQIVGAVRQAIEQQTRRTMQQGLRETLLGAMGLETYEVRDRDGCTGEQSVRVAD